MAEMENKTNEVIDAEENTGLATTAPVQTEPETTNKVGVIGKICTVTAVVTGLVSLGIKGYLKSKKKSAKTSKEDEDVVDTEPTNSEDEVSE